MQNLPKQDVERLWQQVSEDLRPRLSSVAFNTWVLLNPMVEFTILDERQAEATILAQSAFHATNLKRLAHSYLKESLEKFSGKEVSLQFKVSAVPSQNNNIKKQRHKPNQPNNYFNTPASIAQYTADQQTSQNQQSGAPSSTQINNNQTTAGNYTTNPHANLQNPTAFNQANSAQHYSPTVEELFSTQNISMSMQDRALASARRIGLRPDYTFDSFAVSSSNEMAHAAAIAVSQRLGSAYNPLFLYGSVGVGKTHLMHAVGHNILKSNPDTNLIYCTGEEFTNQIIMAIQNKNALRFKEKYRGAQVLFIDDIQFIAGKNTVQEEFFHTFNALAQKGSQIVLTSDRPPNEINLLEDRLKSRFEAGLMVDIQQPSIELRTAIVLIKSRANQIILSMELAGLIAEQIKSARRIEGVITQIRSEVELKKRPISRSLIEEILSKDNKQTQHKMLRVKPTDLIKKVADFYQMQPSVIKGKKRAKEIVLPRHIAMYLLKKDAQLSYVEIGRWFSNRDHTSVMHAVSKVEELIIEDTMVAEDLSKIRLKL